MIHQFRSFQRPLMVLAAGSALALGVAQAQTTAPAASAMPAAAQAAQRLTIREVLDRLEAGGYRDVREIELDHGRYEVKAENARGERVKLKIDARTGTLESERVRR